MDNHTYRFDGVFSEESTNRQIFEAALRPMVHALFDGPHKGHGTCFAYGQTGSGKTVTMEGLGPSCAGDNGPGLYNFVAEELFRKVGEAGGGLLVRAGFFEIHRGKCFDLLNKKKRVEVMEDDKGAQQMVGLQQVLV